MPTVVVRHDLPIDTVLRDRVEDLTVRAAANAEETVAGLTDAELLVCNTANWDDRFLAELDSGDWVQTTSAGYDTIPVTELGERGIALSNAAGVHDSVVAEHAFALALAFSRNIPEFVSKQSDRTWGPRTAVTAELTDWRNDVLTIYGLGNIGEAIAERGIAFGMDVYGVKRRPDDYDGYLPPDRVLASDGFRDALPETDLLVVSVPLTERTRRSIDADVFRALPESSIVVNVARGEVVDQVALLDALRSGEIAGAGLDVFETEPLPEDSPLWSRDDVVVTPHVGGRSNDFPERFVSLFSENLERWRNGESLVNAVT